jgi:predicted DCC family thiol-disulfide oxidoreductase YuxK
MKTKICTRCVSDTTMEEIKYDENGVCNFCKNHDKFIEMHHNNNQIEKLK